ncbi:hypothetical protein [Roseicella sp. DB1501]|uniref:hypothetical protein n=1 Tax=Roseicella sp. DB1501 TaxID=2730925 RepID=UPI0014921F48|nr:hypothetical protein [Roseicella sp. DB1501]NOG73718.1 hypothetical protein [Roseicella sp. DB1501]
MSDPSSPHAVTTSADIGPWGGPTRRYRDVPIEANEKETVFGFHLHGHPMERGSFGSVDALIRIIDAWLDTRTLPAPYRMPEG